MKGQLLLRQAAEFGLVRAMVEYSAGLAGHDPEKWRWRGLAARKRQAFPFLVNFSHHLDSYCSGSTDSAGALLAIGRALKGNVDATQKSVFAVSRSESHYDNAVRAIKFYDFQIASYRKAVDAWSVVARQFGVVKDIRILIAKMIWDSRCEAQYKISL